ncbi:fimbria/pilus outer membrane usher protein [Dongshaea marina]|uniref:fimbria/pilus outer membrane usher protein n=1 Tax=Dongshaea marina TaxID=2047966 RepID=UPI000D3E7633|nr:fimbria/pilus outer membrane usher protein [Dongshaea marina]
MTYPLPFVLGQATTPTSVQLTLDGVPISNGYSVNPGAFQINNIPVVSGNGTIQVKQTDIYGKTTTYAIPYFVNTSLLKAGLDSYDFEAGVLREDYGTKSFDYGQAAVAGSYGYGMNSKWTSRFHGELLSEQQTFGTTQQFQLGLGIASLSSALSHSSSGAGILGQLDYQYSKGGFSAGGYYKLTSDHFTQIGELGQNILSAPRQLGLSIGYGDERLGSVSGAYSSTSSGESFTASYSKSITEQLSLSLSQQLDFGNVNNWNLGLSVSWNFASNDSLSFDSTRSSSDNDLSQQQSMSYSHSSGDLYGLSYNLSAVRNQQEQEDSQNKYNGSMQLPTSKGTLSGMFATQQNSNSYSLNYSGGLVYMEKQLFIAPEIYDSFGVVSTDGVAGLPIYSNNQFLGKTDRNGYLLAPNLQSFYQNSIEIQPNDLPMDYRADSFKKTVVSGYNSGSFIDFGVHKERQGLITLKRSDKKSIPASSYVELTGDGSFKSRGSYMGMDGVLYLSEISSKQKKLEGRVSLKKGKSCKFSVNLKKYKTDLFRDEIACEVSQ